MTDDDLDTLKHIGTLLHEVVDEIRRLREQHDNTIHYTDIKHTYQKP